MRITYSSEYTDNSNLLKSIKEKYDADIAGGGSELTPYLTLKGIDMAADAAATGVADIANGKGQQYEKDAEKLTQRRDNIIDPAMSKLRGMGQFLKGLNRDAEHELGDWGLTINLKAIVYPVEFTEKVTLIQNFIAKHNSFPVGTSPLKPYLTKHPDIDLVQMLADMTTATGYHNDAKQKEKDAEQQFEIRGNKFNPVFDHILGIGQYLMGLDRGSEHDLGEYGFVIDNSPQKPVLRTKKLLPGEKLILKKLNVGGFITIINKGTWQIAISPVTKLTSLKGTRSITNDKYPIRYGFGTAEVENLSSDTEIEISAEFNH